MGISETKKQIVIDNYFKNTCDVNTSIKEAFTRGFELGLKKAPTTSQPKTGHWEHGGELSRVFIGGVLKGINYEDWHCSNCHCVVEQSIKPKWSYCPDCGAKMQEVAK